MTSPTVTFDLFRVPHGDKLRGLLSVVLLLTVPVALWLTSFSTVRTALLGTAARGRALVPGDASPHRVVRAVVVADARLPGSRSCLVRSLASEALLRLYGHVPTHRIGVDPGAEDGFAAHSWLEHDGDVLIGDIEDMARYEALPPLDSGDDA